MSPGRKIRRTGWAVPEPVLGVDIGGVIVSSALTGEDASLFGDRRRLTPPGSGGIESIAILAGGLFSGRGHLASRAGPKTAAISLHWLGRVRVLRRHRFGSHPRALRARPHREGRGLRQGRASGLETSRHQAILRRCALLGGPTVARWKSGLAPEAVST